MPATRLIKIVDETHEISRRRGNGKLRREIWVDGEVARVEETSFDEIEAKFEAEIRAYLKGRRQ